MDATDRFSELVEDYVRYRPDYPQALLDLMEPACRVVELGAGTGILSRQLLARGHRVTAVEPNGPMREACQHPGLRCVEGTAEHTGWNVLQQNLFGSDGCSGFPYGALFVSQTGKHCDDMRTRQVLYNGQGPGDPPAGSPVKMFE